VETFNQNRTPEKLQGQQIGPLSATQDQVINSRASTALIGSPEFFQKISDIETPLFYFLASYILHQLFLRVFASFHHTPHHHASFPICSISRYLILFTISIKITPM
jgi:hypothetical protein